MSIKLDVLPKFKIKLIKVLKNFIPIEARKNSICGCIRKSKTKHVFGITPKELSKTVTEINLQSKVERIP